MKNKLSKIKLCDFHNDFLTCENYKSIKENYNENGYLPIGAVFKGNRDFKTVYNLSKKYNHIFQDGMFAFEELSFSLNEIEILMNFSPKYATLTWNGENNLGYGCQLSGKLRAEGIEAIKLLNQFEIAIDTAHISKEGFFDIIEHGKKVVNSHTCFSKVSEHNRNINEEQIKLLIEKKGIIGLAFYVPFLTKSKTANIENVFEHIDYFVQKFGFKNLCVGSDFYGAIDFPTELKDYSGITLLEEKMLISGYSSLAIQSILKDNLLNFYKIKPTE